MGTLPKFDKRDAMASVEFDPEVVRAQADALYRNSRRIVGTFVLMGAIMGFLIGAVTVTAVHVGTLVLVVTMASTGFVIGAERAERMRCEAQQMLCQLKIEANTRSSSTETRLSLARLTAAVEQLSDVSRDLRVPGFPSDRTMPPFPSPAPARPAPAREHPFAPSRKSRAPIEDSEYLRWTPAPGVNQAPDEELVRASAPEAAEPERVSGPEADEPERVSGPEADEPEGASDEDASVWAAVDAWADEPEEDPVA